MYQESGHHIKVMSILILCIIWIGCTPATDNNVRPTPDVTTTEITDLVVTSTAISVEDAEEDAPTPTDTSPPLPSPIPQTQNLPRYVPISDALCEEFQNALAAQLDQSFVRTIEPFEDFVMHIEGTGCLLVLDTTGREFSDISDLDDGLRNILESRGWEEDILYAAGGPGMILSGFINESMVCLSSVLSEPIDSDLCKDDEPTAFCMADLAPEQIKYTATLQCAELIQ